ncbi:MAG: DNA primase [Deltaproteobacteria bacterium]|nr:DNA primase [Deltaproteobacteria bacterium]
MYFPEEKISEIKNSVDIVDLISEYVNLKKAGRNFLGLCPFHSEKTPSFTVNPEKQIFHCFGCNEGGNAFSFLMKHNSLSFPQAVKMLADKTGIPLPLSGMTDFQKKKIAEKEQMVNANKEAAKYFHYLLLNTSKGKVALDYLKKRKITDKIINKFYLGYSLNMWDGLYKALTKKFAPNILEKAGLIISKNSGYYDRFRNRIIFPIIDAGKRVIGFGGRAIDDSTPKYLNSPETSIYNKSKSLYGFFSTKEEIRSKKNVYIAEGYFDLLALFSYGIKNSVATLGTALTADHIRMLKGYADKMTLVYDADEAGGKAAARSAGIFIKEGVTADVMILPKGYDPDLFLLKFGSEAFYKLSENTLSFMNFFIDLAVKKYGLSVEGKIRIIEEMIKPISSVEDNVARALYIKKTSEAVGVDEEHIIEKLKKSFQNREKQYVGKKITEPSTSGTKFKMEEKIITMMLQFPQIIDKVQNKDILSYFENQQLKKIGYNILNKKGKTDSISDIMYLEDKEQNKIISFLAIKEEVWDTKSCIKLIEQFQIQTINKLKKRYNQLIKNAGHQNNINSLLEKKNRFKKLEYQNNIDRLLEVLKKEVGFTPVS